MGKKRRRREPESESEVEEEHEAESAPHVDLVAFCVSCSTNDPAAFSKRMLNKRGRHGDRVRRCRACVSAAEEAEREAVKSAATSEMGQREEAQTAQESRAAAAPESRAGAEEELERRRKKLLKALRQIDELKQRRAAGHTLEKTQEQKIAREAALQAELALLSTDSSHAEPQPAADDNNDDSVLCSSRRFEFRPPAAARDAAVHSLYNDRETMLPHLSQLCPMSMEDVLSRRARQRRELAQRKSCLMDVLVAGTGELVGTAGFRSTVDGGAEFSILVRRAWQRQGCCTESFAANAQYAREQLGCHRIIACTSEANKPMRAFLAKAGLRMTGRKLDHGVTRLVHETRVEDLRRPRAQQQSEESVLGTSESLGFVF